MQHSEDKQARVPTLADRTLLIVDEERSFTEGLASAMLRRGFEVVCAGSAGAALDLIEERPPAFMVTELRLRDGSGLDIVEALCAASQTARPVVVTGFGDVPTAVAAVRVGALDYISKPASADDVLAALLAPRGGKPMPPKNPMTPSELRQAHIDRVFELYGHNVSETARRLDMHRRTLQRILARR
ncbi:MAG: response regulator [Pseudomonadota bacterium]